MKIKLLFVCLIISTVTIDNSDADLVQYVKGKITGIKNYFRHNHSENEHCDQSDEVTDDETDAVTLKDVETTVSTTGFPLIDPRFGGDANEETTPVVIDNRFLVDIVDNCPDGFKLDRAKVCRKM